MGKLEMTWTKKLRRRLKIVWCCYRLLSAACIPSVFDALATLHWLRLPERVDFKVAVIVYRVLHGLTPPYLSQLTHIADLPGCRRLRSLSTHSLLVPSFRRSTVRRPWFPVAASILWNSLPLDIQSSPSLTVFRQRLKTFLFRQSFPHILL